MTGFSESLAFRLDDFQRTACEHLAAASDVLVAAPTGSGKTVVGEFAVHQALSSQTRAFYTTPIKALSNQKYADLVARHGTDAIGLLTGDVSINGDAPIVVMTTEVLRNMIYAESAALDNLGYVVMDEVHYLADAARGGVWEEVILLLSEQVRLVSLSATVSNAEEFGGWLREVRGETAIVVSEVRPVPLWQHMMVRNHIFDLYSAEDGLPAQPQVNPEVIQAVRQAERSVADRPSRARGRGRERKPSRDRRNPHRGVRPPRREVVIDRLDAAGLLPAIIFVFSRKGCEVAVDQVMASGVRLTNSAERAEIAAVLHELSLRIPGEDLDAVGFTAFATAASRGVAAHHAGLLPVFKEAVEQLFSAGLIKVVFATETLALGINMPARSVVLERLDKWDGRAHTPMTSGEYTQLTGRAGRRGIDLEGHAVVLYSSGIDPDDVVGLASKRTYPLRSSFRPTYNMAVNLLRTSTRDRVRETLEQSFAQYQADAGVVHLARQQRRNDEALAGYRTAMTCERGSITAYLELRAAISEREAEGQRDRAKERRRRVAAELAALRRGDAVEISHGRRSSYAVILTPGERVLDPKVQILTDAGKVKTLSIQEAPHGVRVAAQVRIPKDFNGRDARARRDLTSSLRNALARTPSRPPQDAPDPEGEGNSDLALMRRELRDHPCHSCPDLSDHLRWAQRAHTLQREQDKLTDRIAGRTSSLARDFDRICDVLSALGYLEVSGGDLLVTAQGNWLRRLYSERDLVLAECLRAGIWNDLDGAQLAAAVTTIVYNSRRDEEVTVGQLSSSLPHQLTESLDAALRIASVVQDQEGRAGLPGTSMIDLGFVRTMWSWARGAALSDVLIAGELGAGDLVRWCRQTLDVLDQLTAAAPDPALQRAAREAMDLIRRGVVGEALG